MQTSVDKLVENPRSVLPRVAAGPRRPCHPCRRCGGGAPGRDGFDPGRL